MLNWKNSFLLAFLSSLGLLLRPDLFAADSYATWLYIKGTPQIFLKYQPFARIVFDFMPDNLLFFKLLMFLALFCFFMACFLLINDKRVLLFLVALSPLIIFEFSKFENEIFAYPLIILAFYFFLNNKFTYGIFTTLLSTGFWLFSIFCILAYVPGLVFLSFLFPQFFLPNTATESFLGLSIYLLAGWLLVLPFVFRLDRKKIVLFCIFFVLFVLNSKFWIFLIPFVLFSIGELVKTLEERKVNINQFILPAIILILCWNVALFLGQPTQNEWFLVEETVKISEKEDLTIINDWSYGYWIKFKGGNPYMYGGGKNPAYQEFEKPFVALTQTDLNMLGCSEFLKGVSFSREAKIWEC